MKTEKIAIGQLRLNEANPRTIKDEKFKKLIKSIKEFPQMLEIRPIVVDNDMTVLGGNMRLRACIEAGLTHVPVIRASELTDEQKQRFIIADNVGFGEWDWEALANEWDAGDLEAWGWMCRKDHLALLPRLKRMIMKFRTKFKRTLCLATCSRLGRTGCFVGIARTANRWQG